MWLSIPETATHYLAWISTPHLQELLTPPTTQQGLQPPVTGQELLTPPTTWQGLQPPWNQTIVLFLLLLLLECVPVLRLLGYIVYSILWPPPLILTLIPSGTVSTMCIPSWINAPSRTCCILFSRPTGLGKHQVYLHVIVFLYLTKTHISIFLSASLEFGFARINRTELNNLVPTVVQCNLLILSLYCWLLTLVEPVHYLGKEATVTFWPMWSLLPAGTGSHRMGIALG